MGETSSSALKFTVKASIIKKWQYEKKLRQQIEAEKEQLMDEFLAEIRVPQPEDNGESMEPQPEDNGESMEPQPEDNGESMEPQDEEIWESEEEIVEMSEQFADTESYEKISASHLRHGVVSIVLIAENNTLYECSGASVRHWHRNIKDHHTIFVTTAHFAHKFNEKRTRDDNLRIEVHTPNKATLHGFLGLYDENIAMITTFSLRCVYTLDTCTEDLPRGARNDKLFAFGCASNGTLMGAKCYHPSFNASGLVSVDCEITHTGLGGPIIYFGRGGSEHMAGLITECSNGKATFIPTKMIHEWLQRLLLITSKTSHFRGYSLPDGVKTVIPSGFAARSKIVQILGYPLPPPLVFELNGRLVGKFEERFGQFHYWEEYPFDFSYNYKMRIWEQLGKDVTKKISESVVSVASFHGERKIRRFACTGLLIEGTDCTFVLTSLSLVRNDDAEGDILANLSIEVFLPPDHCAEGVLEMYHENYNIALVRLIDDFTTTISPLDIFSGRESRNNKSVVAIGRTPKRAFGLLMASMGEVKGKYTAVSERKNKHLTGSHRGLDLDCEDLLLSTCEIKKVGIGGPLIGLDGKFIGMNFYDESRTTPFLPRKQILTALSRGDMLLRRGLASRPVNMDYVAHRMTRKRKRNQWPVSKPYWCLSGQGDVLGQLRGKVLM